MGADTTPAGRTTRLASEEQKNPRTVPIYLTRFGGVTHRAHEVARWISAAMLAMGYLVLALAMVLALTGGAG